MKRYNITVNGRTYDVAVEESTGAPVAAAAPVAAPAPAAPVAAPMAAPVVAPAPTPVAGGTAGSISINAPMPGVMVDVKVNVGEAVTKGQVLAVLEAMKMENDLVAPQDGKIASINVKKGDQVESNTLVLTME